MNIRVAQSAGFCSGVKRALGIALEAAKTKSKVCMLGDIVHNEDVVAQITKSGIKKIKRLVKTTGDTLLIRAHGTSKKTYKQARQKGYTIIDATCPMVKEIHRIAESTEKEGYAIVVIGDKQHEEVKGIVGQLKNKAIVFSPKDKIPYRKLKKLKKAAIVVQSTQNFQKVISLVDNLKQYIKKLRFFNTICRPTRIKQQEMKSLPLKNDVMLIIGSKTSANTKRLYEISKSLNKNSYWIQSKKDIHPIWFKGVKTVGITAGASTPDSTTQEILNHLKCLVT